MINKILSFFKLKKVESPKITYCHSVNSESLKFKAWQFTKENYRLGAPDFITQNPNVKLWSQHGGRVLGGEIKIYNGNTFPLHENMWILEYEGNEQLRICLDTHFNDLYIIDKVE